MTAAHLITKEWISKESQVTKLICRRKGCSGFLSTTDINSCCCCCCQVASVVSDSVRPHRRQPTRLPRPWDSPGKNTGVGCHFLLQCIKVKSESEVAQSCLTLSDPMDCSPPASSVHGIFQARVLEWGAIAFSGHQLHVHTNQFCEEALSIFRTIDEEAAATKKVIINKTWIPTWKLEPDGNCSPQPMGVMSTGEYPFSFGVWAAK